MCKCFKIIFCVFIVLFVASVNSNAQLENVYLIKVRECPASSPRSQTGFRANGTKGIYTALHGIVGCKSVKAQSQQGAILSEDLQIRGVDVKNDVALLSSSEVDALPTNGFATDRNVQIQPLSKIIVWGHPFKIKAIDTSATLRASPETILRNLLEDAILEKLIARGSPDPNTTVLSIQGTIRPGESGAPILNENAILIGIANGGLQGGVAEINWAIPFKNVNLSTQPIPAAQMSKLTANSGLFSIDENIPPRFPITKTQTDSLEGKGKMTTTVTISADGKMQTSTEINSTHNWLGFCGKFAVWLFGRDGSVLNTYGQGHQWCVDGRRVPFAGPRDRKDSLEFLIPKEKLNQTYSIAIFHTPGSKDPLALLQENLEKVKNIRTPVEQ